MVIGRFIVGLGVGVGSGVVPMYIAELAPAAYRGRLTTLYTGCITGGQVAAYAVGWWVSATFREEVGWRIGVGLGAVPAVVQAVGLMWQPESPRWLIMRGRKTEGMEVLAKVMGVSGASGAREVRRRIEEIEDRVQIAMEAEDGTWVSKLKDLWRDPHGRRSLGVACMLQGLQQFCGFVRSPIILLVCRL